MQTTAERFASTSSVALIKDLQQYAAAQVALDEDTLFDPGSVYSPAAATPATSLAEGGGRLYEIILSISSSVSTASSTV